MRSTRRIAFAAVCRTACTAVWLASCGARVEPARPVGKEFIEVDYPPPPAQIEEMTETLAGRPDCRWMDGSYSWQGRRWEWSGGRWVVPPAGCAHFPGTLFWSKPPKARLYYTPAGWYPTDPSRRGNDR
ncbi:MAG TPA: hypothetical protein VIM73_12975, partial [Polyangiaceae bacterium]